MFLVSLFVLHPPDQEAETLLVLWQNVIVLCAYESLSFLVCGCKITTLFRPAQVFMQLFRFFVLLISLSFLFPIESINVKIYLDMLIPELKL